MVADSDLGVDAVLVGASADWFVEKRCSDAKDITKGKLTGSFIVVSIMMP